jgi:hypothetical protein
MKSAKLFSILLILSLILSSCGVKDGGGSLPNSQQNPLPCCSLGEIRIVEATQELRKLWDSLNSENNSAWASHDASPNGIYKKSVFFASELRKKNLEDVLVDQNLNDDEIEQVFIQFNKANIENNQPDFNSIAKKLTIKKVNI